MKTHLKRTWPIFIVLGIVVLVGFVVSATYAGTSLGAKCTEVANTCNFAELPQENGGCWGFEQTGDSCLARFSRRCSGNGSAATPKVCENNDYSNPPRTCDYNDTMACGKLMQVHCTVDNGNCTMPQNNDDGWQEVPDSGTCYVHTCN